MNSDPVADALEVLQRTPRSLRALLEGLSERWTDAADHGAWSASEVVGHLIHGEVEDWIPRARIVLGESDSKDFVPFDPDGFEAHVAGLDLAARLDRFETLRTKNVEALRGLQLSRADLDRTGVHPAFGEVTLGQLLATWTVHDLGHVAQIARAMASRWRDDVGPWRAYLPVLEPRA